MTTRHLVDPELVPALDIYSQLSPGTPSVEQMRAMMATMQAARGTCMRDDVERERRIIAGPAGAPEIEVLIYRSRDRTAAQPVYLHIHGGGFVSGSAMFSEPGNVEIAARLGCVVVSVDYRLAPETPAPGAVEDCHAALRWVHDSAEELGIDRTRIAIGGESAGGGLAAALAILARDRAEVPLCFQLLIYPMLDDRTVMTATPNPFSGEYVWTAAANRIGWTALLGHEPGAAGVSAYAAAARADDLHGLPPTYLAVGALDIFVDENIAFAHRLLRAGVPTELHVFPGAYHGFEMAVEAQVAVAAGRERLDALARAFRV